MENVIECDQNAYMENEATKINNGLQTIYLELLKKTLTHSLWTERTRLITPATMSYSLKRHIVASVIGILHKFRIGLVREIGPDQSKQAGGESWPEHAHTMIGLKRLNNIQECVENIIRDDVPGDLIETGVWRGGAVIFMRGILKAYQINDRTVWVADSFEGLPIPNVEKYPQDKGDKLFQKEFISISQEEVIENFKNYDLLDDQVRFLPGWFKDTLSIAPMERLSLIRLDGDMYQSTIEALENLYSKLSRGGYVIVDDYAWPACRQAVDDFRSREGIADSIKQIDKWGAYWRRS